MVTNIREVRTGSWVGIFPNSIPEDSTKIGIMRVCILNLILEMKLNHFSKIILCITGEVGLESGFTPALYPELMISQICGHFLCRA